jgi:cytochrome c biogenesis protein CcmG, thiol:disulfide interchange protein DsbE
MNWRRAGLSFTLVVPLLGLLAFGMTLDPRTLPSTLPGRVAPDFDLAIMEMRNDPAGPGTARLSDHRGEVVVVNFWASWCLSCRGEHPILNRIAHAYDGRGVHFYGVLYNDVPRYAERYIADRGGQIYPTLLDPGSRIAIEYGVSGVPETFFIGPDGVVGHKQIGPVTERVLVEWIERLLPADEGPR